ncbi:hypothetical protein PJM46_29575, partial [Mycobacterium kansasii]
MEEEVEYLKAENDKLELMLKNSQSAWEQERSKFTEEPLNVQEVNNSLKWKTERAELKDKIKVLELEVRGQHTLNLNLLTEN